MGVLTESRVIGQSTDNMKSITLDAPAKINLYLDVISKRRDSYHNIATIFQKLKICDTIKVSIVKKGISLCTDSPDLPSSRANLAYKAASLVKNEFKIKDGIAISIKKRIPIAAGLGGGSSDAASVIAAMAKLFNLRLSRLRLILLARAIGADVGFFTSGYNCAIGRGIGDRLTEIKTPAQCYILALVPRVYIYTKTIYSKLTLRLTKPGMDVNLFAHILSSKDGLFRVRNSLYNRLEDAVLPIYPIVSEGKKILSLYTEGVLLSGSGPTVFALFRKRKEAVKAKKDIKADRRWQLFLTETA